MGWVSRMNAFLVTSVEKNLLPAELRRRFLPYGVVGFAYGYCVGARPVADPHWRIPVEHREFWRKHQVQPLL